MTVIDDARRTTNPLKVEITPLLSNITYGTEATLNFQVSNGYSPNASVVQSVYFQLDTIQGPWVQASPSDSNWTATVSSLTYGKHEVFVLALEAQGDGVPAGVANAYTFYSLPPNMISPTSASFDKYTRSAGHTDISTTYALNGNTLTSITNDATNLALGTDYTVLGNTIAISKAYLAAQPVGPIRLTYTFSDGTSQTLEVTVNDSTPPPPQVTAPETPNTTPPATPPPTVEVFNSSVVNETNLVKTIESKVEEAKEANATIDFADTQGHWAEKTIEVFIKMQLIKGYEDGTVRPNSPITRAEFATILNRAFNIQSGSVASVVLKDIGDSWAKEAIENLVAAGVINGYMDGKFKPDQTITREEMVVMLSRIVNLNNLAKDQAKGNFNDLNDAYAASEIIAEAQVGIVSGKGDGRFDPKGNATRAEALQIILNVLELNPQLKTLLDSLS